MRPCSKSLQHNVLAMLIDAFSDENIGMRIKYRYAGSAIKTCRLQARSKVGSELNQLFFPFFSDDCALNGSLDSDMQEHTVDRVSVASIIITFLAEVKFTRPLKYRPAQYHYQGQR